jgi:hypothetical protein
LWTTTTNSITGNSITDKARRDKTRQRSQLGEQASQRFRAHRSGAQRAERGRECGREGARGHQPQTSHKPERKRSINSS